MQYEKRFQSFKVEEFADYPFQCPSMDHGFLTSIHEYGIIQPPVIGLFTENRKRSYKIISGQRRIKAHMHWANEDPDFPQEFEALVILKAHKIPYNELVVIANTHDNPNPFTDLMSVQALIKSGETIQEIAKSIYKSTNYVKKILQLANLPDEIIQAGADGEIAKGTLYDLAKKETTQINTALEVYRDTGKLTGSDVSRLAKTHRNKLVKELFSDSSLYEFEQDDETVVQDTKPYVVIQDDKIVSGVIKGFDQARSALLATGNGAKLYALVPVQ